MRHGDLSAPLDWMPDVERALLTNKSIDFSAAHPCFGWRIFASLFAGGDASAGVQYKDEGCHQDCPSTRSSEPTQNSLLQDLPELSDDDDDEVRPMNVHFYFTI